MDDRFVRGVYRGFTWSGNSPVLQSEMELIITDKDLEFRFAVDIEDLDDMLRGSIPLSEILDLTPAEIADDLNKFAGLVKGADIKGIVGIALREGGFHLLLWPESTEEEVNADVEPGEEWVRAIDEPRVRVFGMPTQEEYGHSFLFTPDQVAAGAFDREVARIALEYGNENLLPRLKYR